MTEIRDPRDKRLDALNRQPFLDAKGPTWSNISRTVNEDDLVEIAHAAYIRTANMEHLERLRLVVRAIRKALARE